MPTKPTPCRALFIALIAMLLAALAIEPVLAQSQDNPSGLPLPRFASTRSQPVNVRVGPGTRYDIVWIYVKSGQPVEVIQEFDTWRKIRDIDGEEGWVHQNLLSGDRHGIITPILAGENTAMRADPDADASVRAWLGAAFPVSISECENGWCQIAATITPEGGRAKSYSGYVEDSELWGVYPGESFD